MARLKEQYNNEIKAKLKSQFGYKSDMQIPKITKITVNCVTRDCVTNGKLVEGIIEDLSLITGQKAVVARAKKSIATFKVREGQALGGYVTLRNKRMYEFLDRLINLSLPRVKDFRGLSPKAFDGKGNYNLGIKEQIMFPEVNYDKIDKIRGMGITITTTATTNEEGRALLGEFGFPFKTTGK